MKYIYDGSYAGFLSCVFECFERKEFLVQIVSEKDYAPGFFEQDRKIDTLEKQAKRVFNGLNKKLGGLQAKDFYKVFLSEDQLAIQYAFDLTIEFFLRDKVILENFGNEKVLYFSQVLKKVNRERHRMKAFVRFEKSLDGMFFATIAPDFNVLPLITDFFKNRYADQDWLLYDEKRKYGMLYSKKIISEVQLTEATATTLATQNNLVELDIEEQKYQQLWKSYFKSTNIEARRNMKLHLKHVPKRYWRFLPEKQ